MSSSDVDRSATLLAEYADLEGRLADPAVHADQARARRLGRRYAELAPIVETARELDAAARDLDAARELAAEDAAFAAEADDARGRRSASSRTGCASCCCPRDPDDAKDVILEVKAGRAARSRRCSPATCCGCTCATPSAAAGRPRSSTPRVRPRRLQGRRRRGQGARTDEGVWARLKYEGGVHRVQRVPVTESQGRIHTSAAGVLVLPEAEEVEVDDRPERPAHRRVPLVRPGRAERQHHRLRRAHHPPAHRHRGVAARTRRASCRTRSPALRVLRARLLAAAREEAAAAATDPRRSQVRTVDRSERVRTYNFPENRIADHRVGYKAYNLDAVLDGDLDAVHRRARPRRHRRAAGGRLLSGAARRCSPTPRAGWPRPGSSRRGWTPSCCSPTCSACPAPGCSRWSTCRTTSPSGSTRWWTSGPTACRCSTSSAGAPFRHLELAVGPGVFVPRPETELLAGWALERLAGVAGPVVVDLCAGSGAIALAIAHERPRRPGDRGGARSRARWSGPGATRGPGGGGRPPVEVLAGDIADPALLLDLDGAVDVVVANPPYVPDGAGVEPEVADHDPPVAVFAGPDGLAVVRGLCHGRAAAASRRRAGHRARRQQAESVPALAALTAGVTDVVDHPRPRRPAPVVTAPPAAARAGRGGLTALRRG